MRTAFRRIGGRRTLQGSAAAVIVLGLLLWWLVPWDEDTPSGILVFSTGAGNGVYQRYGALLKGELGKDMPHLKVRLVGSAGSEQNVERVAKGQADFTIGTADAVEYYRLEHGPGAGRLRGCARLYDDYVHLVVPASSPVHSIDDLRGERVATGQPGSGVRLVAERILRAAGLDPYRDVESEPLGIDTAPEKLRHGDIDAFFWSGGLPTRAVSDLSATFDIRFVPLGGLVDALHRQRGASAYYRASDMPADAYPKAQHGDPVSTVAVANLLITSDRVGAGLTEGMTRTVIDSRDRIGKKVHAAQRVDLRTALYTDPLPLHKGASRYYRSVKP